MLDGTPTVAFANRQATVIDGVLSPDAARELLVLTNGLAFQSVHHDEWRKAWRLHDGTPLRGPTTWYGKDSPEPLPPYWFPTGTPVDSLLGRLLDLTGAAGHLVGREGREWDRIAMVPWIYPVDAGLSVHADGGAYSGAFTYFLHTDWQLAWGGILILLDPTTPSKPEATASDRSGLMEPPWLTDEASSRVLNPGHGIAVLPKPNRLVIMAPECQHMITRVDRAAGQNARLSYAGFFVAPRREELPANTPPPEPVI
jgi:hypothetical protein